MTYGGWKRRAPLAWSRYVRSRNLLPSLSPSPCAAPPRFSPHLARMSVVQKESLRDRTLGAGRTCIPWRRTTCIRCPRTEGRSLARGSGGGRLMPGASRSSPGHVTRDTGIVICRKCQPPPVSHPSHADAPRLESGRAGVRVKAWDGFGARHVRVYSSSRMESPTGKGSLKVYGTIFDGTSQPPLFSARTARRSWFAYGGSSSPFASRHFRIGFVAKIGRRPSIVRGIN
jgi:hypothetical protein